MLSGLARFAAFGLAFYLLVRLIDIGRQGHLDLIFAGGTFGNLFLVEMGMCTLVPLILFSIPAVRRNQNGIFIASLLCVLGFVLNRINTSGLAQVWATGSDYFPMWTEFVISLGIVAGFALIFFYIQEHFPVEPELESDQAKLRRLQLFELPRFDHASRVWLGERNFAARRVYSLLFVVAFALGLALVPWRPPVKASPVERARGGDVLLVGYPLGTVPLPHEEHVKRIGKDRCGVCHHLNIPGDEGTPCSVCHSDMYLARSIFDHDLHVGSLGGNGSCHDCHGTDVPKVAATAKVCSECHRKDMMAANEIVREFDQGWAPGLRAALHVLCIDCHEREAQNPEWDRPDLARCAACHRTAVPHRERIREARDAGVVASGGGSRTIAAVASAR
jgi:hypothetical protein